MGRTLDELIPQYAENKNELDSYKKLCDKDNAEIKKLMKADGVTKKEAGGYVATYSVSKRETMNEDKLLDLLKKNGYENVISTKEYVNMEELEKSIYAGDIDKETLLAMDDCKDTKEVVTLRISKVKEKEDE